MARRKRLKRKKIGYWKIKKKILPSPCIASEIDWKPLPKAMYHPRRRK